MEVPGAFLFFSLSIHPFGIGAILVGTGLAVHAGKHKQDERTDAGDQVQQQEPGAHIDVVQPPCPEGEEREQNSQPINRLDHTEDGKNPGQDAQDQGNDEVDKDGRIRQRYKNMIKLRNSSKAFSIGDFECVHKVGHVYGFVRCYHDEKYLFVANLGTREERARVDVARYGMRKLKCQTSDDNSLLESSDGIHFIDIPRLWIKVYKVEK